MVTTGSFFLMPTARVPDGATTYVTMVGMSTLRTLGLTVLVVLRAIGRFAKGTLRTGRFLSRTLGIVRRRGGVGEAGMIRLLDLHGASCAGDTLVAIGLAGTVFFTVPVGEARGRVALYLLVTMLPFAVLAPVVGPVLDRFRHGRRYALAVTMLGRAFLAYVISDHLTGFTLYPAAFGMLVLSRAYGVARSAAVPRILPPGMGLSEAGARASVFGTMIGAAIVPVGLLTYYIGPKWTLRTALVVFVVGMVIALRLPPRADDQPPETLPRLFKLPRYRGEDVLSGRLVVASLAGSATLRAVYGFLTLFLAFSIRSGHQSTVLFHWTLDPTVAIGVAAGALGLGSFLATAIGTSMQIRHPAVLQAVAIAFVTVAALLAAQRGTLLFVAVLCLVTAIGSGLAKLAIDATIQERVPEAVRASAFAHSETTLMIAWVVGGGLGLIPFGGGTGLVVVATFLALGLARAVIAAVRLRRDRLRGTPAVDAGPAPESTGVPPQQPRSATTRRTPPAPAQRPQSPPEPRARPAADPQPVARTRRPLLRWRGGAAAKGGPAAASAETATSTAPVLVESESDAGASPAGYHLYRPDPTLSAEGGEQG